MRRPDEERFRLRPGLYGIVDGTPDGRSGRIVPDPVELAEALLAGGAVALQLRLKGADPNRVLETARRISPLARAARVPFIVNDFVATALQCGADAVHLGQDDLPLADALQQAAGRLSVGISTHTCEQARAAANGGASYIGFGPIFGTGTKPRAGPAVGIIELRRVCESVDLPVVAIGNISADSAESVALAGAAAAAAISAVNRAVDVAAAAARFNQNFLEGYKRRPGSR